MKGRSRWAVAVAVCAALSTGFATVRPQALAAQSPNGAPTYRVYVANESSDIVSRVAFTPGQGAVVEAEIPVGIMPGDIDGAHGISVSPDGEYWYVSIAHGTPQGYVWKFHAGPDTLVARTRLGLFPATMGITPDGQFLLAANFNLHGDRVPSDVSVVYTPDMVELAKIETCLMPHGSRVSADGTKQYSACMHSDELVEIDMATFEVSRRFAVVPGHEMALEGSGMAHDMDMGGTVCSPTWAEPGTGPRANRSVFVACNKNREILEIDTRDWTLLRRFPTGNAPYNLEATADGSRLVVTLKGEQSVAVFDLETGKELGRVPASRSVTHGVVASPDGRYAFVSNEAIGSTRGTLDVIDLERLEVVASVELGHQSGGIDFWRVTAPGS
ncbi:MAG: YncE family protein [Gemmatimonadota bacterium]|nr:YncE family protein [Gemmatimonadota bacterium]